MNDKITERYNEALTKLKIKNKDICEKFTYTPTKASDIKTGKNKITPEFALELEDKFGINPCWLFFGKGSIKSSAGFDLSSDAKEPMSVEALYEKVQELSNSVEDMKDKYGEK